MCCRTLGLCAKGVCKLVTITEKILTVTVVLALSACSVPFSDGLNVSPEAQEQVYSVDQNAIGEYVFCMNGECPERTPKVLAEYIPYPQPAVHRDSIQVFFKLADSRLKPSAVSTLSNVLPDLIRADRILVRGWADSIGGRQTKINKRLAKERANVIRNWLVKQGVVTEKIRVEYSPACCNASDTRTVVIRWQ